MEKTLAERVSDIWDRMRSSTPRLPSRVMIPVDHVDRFEELQDAFVPNKHYFQVRINQMYLGYDRLWFKEYDPMVFVVSEFTYDKKTEVVPYLLGPALMQEYGQQLPEGMVFADTRVAGVHPYRGGRLSLSIVLCRVKRKDYAMELLKLVESAAGVLDFSTALSSYVKIAEVVVKGVDALFGGGDTAPLIGFRKEYDPEAGDELAPRYYALIDKPVEQVELDELWVRDNQLFTGKRADQAKPFREADFVLYSIAQVQERQDLSTLPFYPLWERVVQEATMAKEDNWQSAKANMLSLYQTMMLSPDLTSSQAEMLTDEYVGRMTALQKRAVSISILGEQPGEQPAAAELDPVRTRSVSILDL